MLSAETFYWLFSSIFQGITGFFAFVFAGYVLYLQNLQSTVAQDDTLTDIVEGLKKTCFKNFKGLSFLSIITLIFALGMLFFNQSVTDVGVRSVFSVLGASLAVGALVFGLYFVLSLIDPHKVEKEAAYLLEKSNQALSAIFERPVAVPTGAEAAPVQIGAFFPVVAKVETILRNVAADHGTLSGRVAMSQLSEYLRRSQMVTEMQYNQLKVILRYRNIIAHGRENKVPARVHGMALKLLSELSEKYPV